MKFMEQMASQLGGQGGAAADGAPGADGGNMMEGLMSEFTKFLSENEENGDLKGAFDNILGELVNKDTLYEPMKLLKEKYPVWLEKNHETLSEQDIEKYNK